MLHMITCKTLHALLASMYLAKFGYSHRTSISKYLEILSNYLMQGVVQHASHTVMQDLVQKFVQ